MDIRLMSIGFFIKPTDALLWRGAMAVSALKQMIHQTKWGTLDFLLADLPPGTGDLHLSIIGELKIDSAVIVSTPQQVAVADVVRGVEMFHKSINIRWRDHRKHGLVFEETQSRYCPSSAERCTPVRRKKARHSLKYLSAGRSPEGSDEGRPAAGIDPRVEKWYCRDPEKIVEKVMKSC